MGCSHNIDTHWKCGRCVHPEDAGSVLNKHGMWSRPGSCEFLPPCAQEGIPVYAVLTNEQLAAIAIKRPDSLATLREVEGVGEGTEQAKGCLSEIDLTTDRLAEERYKWLVLVMYD